MVKGREITGAWVERRGGKEESPIGEGKKGYIEDHWWTGRAWVKGEKERRWENIRRQLTAGCM